MLGIKNDNTSELPKLILEKRGKAWYTCISLVVSIIQKYMSAHVRFCLSYMCTITYMA